MLMHNVLVTSHQRALPFIFEKIAKKCYNKLDMKYLIILGIIILAWCPWLKAEEAVSIVDAKVAQMQAQNPDLCTMFIHRDSIQKVPFGYTEKVSYDCTLNDDVYGVLKATNVVFITFYKGIFGMPKKTFK